MIWYLKCSVPTEPKKKKKNCRMTGSGFSDPDLLVHFNDPLNTNRSFANDTSLNRVIRTSTSAGITFDRRYSVGWRSRSSSRPLRNYEFWGRYRTCWYRLSEWRLTVTCGLRVGTNLLERNETVALEAETSRVHLQVASAIRTEVLCNKTVATKSDFYYAFYADPRVIRI